MSMITGLALKRFNLEETRCKEDCSLSVERLDELTLRISFDGPEGTQYLRKYIIRVIVTKEYPFKPPQVYFEGDSPNHRFYLKDQNSYLTPKRTTNLANSDFGVFYEWWCPQRTMINIVERIKHSLTLEGENEMDSYMCSYS